MGSHAPPSLVPFEAAEEQLSESQTKKPARPRRATLPSIIINSPERESLLAVIGQECVQKHIQDENEEYMGFAVTSGSNPKRRSKSADNLYDVSKAHRMSPIQWRRWRRRSDEIKYLRESTTELDPSPTRVTKPSQETAELEKEKDHGEDEELPQSNCQEDEDSRHTFDFGLLATTMQSQDQVGIEERVVTVEVKLMDLEYAISKLQAQTPSPVEHIVQKDVPGSLSHEKTADYIQSQVQHQTGQQRFSADSSIYAQDLDDSTMAGSHSTQLTSHSSLGHESNESKIRPTSTATTVRPQTAVQRSPSHISNETYPRSNRGSLTSLTIEHYTTLIALLRREQSARMRLEDQVTELQRQVMEISLSTKPDYRARTWQNYPSPQKSNEFITFRANRSDNEADETDTDDGFQDVYETPIEHKEFERPPFGGILEGEAF